MSTDKIVNQPNDKAILTIGNQYNNNYETKSRVEPTDIPWNVPLSDTTKFIGREKQLDEIHEKLFINDSVPIAIHGTGGIGKTELAIQYALKYKKSYEGGICFFNARGENLATSILGFARSYFDIDPPKESPIKNKLDFYWSRWPQGKVLIIYDDVDNFDKIKEYFPPVDHFKLLITTRLKFGPYNIHFENIPLLDESAALDVLKSSLPEKDKRIEEEINTAKKLCQWLDCLPLTLNLVGIHLAYKQDLSISTMLERLNKENLGQKAIDKINGVIELSWEELSEDAKQLSYCLSLFALAPIHWETAEEFLGEKPYNVEELRDEELLKFNLLQRKEKGLYQFHNIIREFIKNKRDQLDSADDLKNSFCGELFNYISTILNEILSSGKVFELVETRGFIYLEPHLEEIANTFTHLMDSEDLFISHLLMLNFNISSGNYHRAIEWGKQHQSEINKLQIESSCSEGDDYKSLIIRHQLARVYSLQGKFIKAEEYLEEILEDIKTYSEDDFASLLNLVLSDLGKLLATKGKFEEAEDYCKQALEIKQKLVDNIDNIPDLITDLTPNLNALANVYRIRGQYEEAEKIYKRLFELLENGETEKIKNYILINIEMVIDIFINNSTLYLEQGLTNNAENFCEDAKSMVEIFGNQHPIYATCLSNLAQVYIAQGRHQEAEETCQEAIKINQNNGNKTHPTHAINLRSLGSIYSVQGRYYDAEKLYEQALDIQKQIYGEEHREVAKSLVHLAVHHIKQSDYKKENILLEKAKILLEKAQKIYESVLSKTHPEYADLLSMIANYHCCKKEYKKASDLYEEAINIISDSLGDKHLKYIEKLNDYAAFLASQNRKEEAAEYYKKSLDIVEELFGENNPIVCEYMLMIAETQRSLGDEKKAESMYAKAIGIYENDKSINPDFSEGLMRLIEVYQFQGRYDEVGALYKRLLEVSRKLLGNEHPNVVNILNKWAKNLTDQQNYEEAAKLYEESLEIRKSIFHEKHPSIAINMVNLAFVYDLQEKLDDAEKLYKEALEININEYGDSHKKVIVIENALAQLSNRKSRKSTRIEDNPVIIEDSISVSSQSELLQNEQPASNEKEVTSPEINEQSEAVNSKTLDIEKLKEQNAQLENERKELQKQNAKLKSELEELQEQQNRFQAEIKEYQDSNLKDQIEIHKFVEKLIQLNKEEYTKLSQPLKIVLNDLEKHEQDYQQTWNRLQTAIQQFNKYKEETDEISFNLNAHYKADCALNENPLPLDRQKVNEIIQKVRQLLAELDKELADALIKHEQSQKKLFITF